MSVHNLDSQITHDARINDILLNVKDIRRRIEEAISKSGSSDAARIAAGTLGQVAALEGQLAAGSVPSDDIPNLMRVIASMQAFADTVEQVAAASPNKESDDLTAIAGNAQKQAASFMRDLRQYDGLLQFDSAEQERAYHEREAERRQRLEAGLAQGTPEGALQASGAAYTQAVDLAAHGGSADPALMRRVDELAVSTTALREQIIRDGGDVSKFDENMRDDLRAVMRSKGIPDARIDALLAEHKDNPINAMKTFVEQDRAALTERDVEGIQIKVSESGLRDSMSQNDGRTENLRSAPLGGNIPTAAMEAIADLQDLRLAVSEHDAGALPDHGVAAQVATAETGIARRT